MWYTDTDTIQVQSLEESVVTTVCWLDKLQFIVAEIFVILIVILVLSSGTNHPVRVNKFDQTWIVFMLEIIQYFSSVFLTIQSSLAVVVNDGVVSLLEQFDGGEPLDLHVLQLIGSGVHLGNDDTATDHVLETEADRLFPPNI